MKTNKFFEKLIIPKVSICIPAYNEPLLFIRAIDSVLIQSFTDYEIIITDDTPDYKLKSVVNQKYRNIEKLRYYKNPITLGPTANWNHAVSLANSNLIKILHHDDWFTDENSLQKFITPFLHDPDLGFVFCQSNHFDGDKYLETRKPGNEEVNNFIKDPTVLFCKNFIISPSSTLYKKTTLIYDTNLTWMVDTDYYIMLLENFKSCYIPEPLINLNISQGRLTTSCENNPRLLVEECKYLLGKYENSQNAKSHIIKYFRKVICIHKLYDFKILKSKTGLEVIPQEMKSVIISINFRDRIHDFIYRFLSSTARFILGKNYKARLRNLLNIKLLNFKIYLL